MSHPQATITHTGTAERGEYIATLPETATTGRLTWHLAPNGRDRIADHTLVPTEIGGRGIAAQLVEALVADARAQGFKIVPACSYVVAAFRRHPDWADVAA